MSSMMCRAFWVVAAALLMPALALAQTASPPAQPPTVINFAPIVNDILVPIVVALAGVLATWLSIKLARLLGLKNEEQVRQYLEPALQNALAYGQSQIGKLPLTIDAKNQIVATAANFAIAHVNDGLKLLGVDKEGLLRLLEARLQSNINAQTPEITATTGPAPSAAPAPTATAIANAAPPADAAAPPATPPAAIDPAATGGVKTGS